jgi:hypothetical protein
MANIHTTTTISFGVNHASSRETFSETLETLAKGWMYPKGEWFSLSLGGGNETHVGLEEWEELKTAIQEMIDRANTVEIK